MSELWQRPLLLAVLLVALSLLVWLPRRGVATRGVALFRCLLPSWRFFDQIGSVPALHYRAAPHGDDWGDWQNALPVPARTAGSLWLNATGNLHLACRSLVEHLQTELEELATAGVARAPATASPGAGAGDGGASELISYRLVCALIEGRARAALPASPQLRYQFRLLDSDADAASFVSGVHGAR